ncbi:MAG: helix-turn-helix domain-containing protein [Clostridia bacterium]|nr:helix-turn-helix domain-containing protein [Clostridia bacterium]
MNGVQIEDRVFEVPEIEDCSAEEIPSGTLPCMKSRRIEVAEVLTMKKHLFDHYRLPMFSFINAWLKNGRLSALVGTRVQNKWFNRNTCGFEDVSFWRIDRENFYADVKVSLKLETACGPLNWNGYLILWCGFKEDFFCEVEELTDSIDRQAEGYTRLSNYLVPYYTNKQIDELAEKLWMKYLPEALFNPSLRDAVKLADSMGLKVQYLPVYVQEETRSFDNDPDVPVGNRNSVEGILYFEEDGLLVVDGDGETLKTVRIPARTIVVNTNSVRQEYSQFSIFHECLHDEEHYLFYRLQQLRSNDLRKMKKVEIEESERCLKDPVYFMEKQANRAAYALMLPEGHTRTLIERALGEVRYSRHAGEKYEIAGKQLAKDLNLPNFRIRARMIQLGYIEAKGALNYVEKKLIRPFAFNAEAWKEDVITFVIDPMTARRLRKTDKEFNALLADERYVYADGHFVKNSPRYVIHRGGKAYLSIWAEKHVDECCLRFIRRYVQVGIGRYVYGRMYYDADYIAQTDFFLAPYKTQQMDEFDAKKAFFSNLSREFAEMIKALRQMRKLSLEKLAEKMSMDDAKLGRWLQSQRDYRNEDFLTALCLALELPDWISSHVFKIAGVQLDPEDKRQAAILRILRVQSAEGIEAADQYLIDSKLAPLSYGQTYDPGVIKAS